MKQGPILSLFSSRIHEAGCFSTSSLAVYKFPVSCLNLVLFDPKDWANIFFENVRERLQDYTASHPRRPYSSSLLIVYNSTRVCIIETISMDTEWWIYQYNNNNNNIRIFRRNITVKKGKSIPVTGRGGPSVCETLRLPHVLDNRLTDGGEVISLKRLPSFTPRNIPGTHFCKKLSRPHNHIAAGRIKSIEKSDDLIANRTRDLPACSIVPQPTTPKIRNGSPVFRHNMTKLVSL
jgi:hypothetical protein